MIRRILLCGGLLLSAIPLAHAVSHYLEPTVLGFTADGQTFVYVERNSQTLREDGEVGAVVLDVKSGKSKSDYHFSRTEIEKPDPERIAFQTWLKKNPIRCVGGPRSPDGQYALRILQKSAPTIPSGWHKQVYTFGAEEGSGVARPWGIFRLLLQQGRKSLLISKWEFHADWALDGSFTPCWSPDGQRLALITVRPGHGMRDQGEMDVLLFPLTGPLAWEFPPLRP